LEKKVMANAANEPEKMRLTTKEGVSYFEFPAFSGTNQLRHGFSTRLGGVSVGAYATMNLSFTMGDTPEHVSENYRRMAAALGVETDNMTSVWQAHTDVVRVVTMDDAGKGITKAKETTSCDGMVTQTKGLTLVTLHADCLPLYFFDPVTGSIGLAHSGWRGTQQKIGLRTLEKMEQTFGTKREDVLAGIGPGISQPAFEVGREVFDAFLNSADGPWDDAIFAPTSTGKYLLDLPKANELLLLASGIKRQHLSTAGRCTFNDRNLFYSHRRDGTVRGSMAAFLGMV